MNNVSNYRFSWHLYSRQEGYRFYNCTDSIAKVIHDILWSS